MLWPSVVASTGEAMATVGEHDCGWGVLRLRVNGLSVSQRRREWVRNRILVLALFHGSRPLLGLGTESRYFRRAIRLCTLKRQAKGSLLLL